MALSHEDLLDPDPDLSDPEDLLDGFRSISLSELLPLLPERVTAEKREDDDDDEARGALAPTDDDAVTALSPRAAVR